MKENWVNIALKDHSIASSYIKYLNEFSSEEYIESLRLEFAEKENFLRNLLIKELIGMDHIHYLEINSENLRLRSME